MPIARYQMPDGRIGRFEVPEGTTPEQAQEMISARITAKRKTLLNEEDAITKAAKSFNEDSSFGQNLLAGAGKAFTDIGRGVAQLTPWGPSKAEIDEIARRDAPLMDTAGGLTGNIAGNVAGLLPTAFIPGVNTVAGGAALGGLSAMMAPAGENDSRLERGAYGTAFGAAVPSVIKAGGSLIGKGKNLVDSLLPGGTERLGNRILNTVAGDKKQEVLNALLANKSVIPGSAATAGEAAVPAGSAEFAALQKLVKSPLSSDYDAIEQAQKAARLGLLQSNKPNLEKSLTTRAKDAATNYGAASKEVVKTDSTLNELLSRPSMSKILSRASDLAKEEGKTFKIGKDIPEQLVEGKIVSEAGIPLSKTIIPAQQSKFPVDSLHYMKMAMDDLIKNPERFGIGAAEARAITGTREKFVDWVGKKSTAYDFARTEFAKQSVPINQSQVISALENKLQNPVGSESALSFLRVLDDPTLAMKKATGFKRYDELGQVLNPKQLSAAENVASELERKTRFNDLASKGVEHTRKLIGQAETDIPPTGMFSPILSVARGILNRALGRADDKSMAYLSELMKDPQATAQAMQLATPQQKALLLEVMGKYRNPALIGAPSMAVSQGLLSQPQPALLNPTLDR